MARLPTCPKGFLTHVRSYAAPVKGSGGCGPHLWVHICMPAASPAFFRIDLICKTVTTVFRIHSLPNRLLKRWVQIVNYLNLKVCQNYCLVTFVYTGTKVGGLREDLFGFLLSLTEHFAQLIQETYLTLQTCQHLGPVDTSLAPREAR
jgi:hypothetical protein